jgi:hypothetical protein
MLLVFHFFEKLAKTSCFAMPFCSFPSPQKRVKDLFRHEFHRFGAFLCQTNGHCKTNGHAISTCARYFCNSALRVNLYWKTDGPDDVQSSRSG